jgi:hypothetical protein
LSTIYDDYWIDLVGDAEVYDMNDIYPALRRAADSESLARAAFQTWLLISQFGESTVRESMSRRTWARRVALLRSAGLSWTDISTGKISPIRRKPVVLGAPVTEHNCRAA